MEFKEKLQELRKQKGLTQEELAQKLYVSRTAVSKWESGKGYPSIDSLKNLAQFFSVTVDEFLSGEELLNIAQEEKKMGKIGFRDLSFGLLDISVFILFFLPFFAERTGSTISGVSLLSLITVSLYLKILYCIITALIILWGVLTLAFQNCDNDFWIKIKGKISILLNALAVLLFVLSLQPYAAILLFVFLAIKVLVYIKK